MDLLVENIYEHVINPVVLSCFKESYFNVVCQLAYKMT